MLQLQELHQTPPVTLHLMQAPVEGQVGPVEEREGGAQSCADDGEREQ